MSGSSRLFSRVLLTNDDGIDALGLRTLTELAEELAEEVWIVAPDHDQSGTSHSLSLHSPLRVSQKDERRYSVAGTSGDCVVMVVRHPMMSGRPDLILSGINRGANLGVETVFSGTVGAAMTGMLLGIPSMALSQAFSNRNAVISLAQPSTLSPRGCGGIGGLRHWTGADIGHSPKLRADQSEHSCQHTSWRDRMMSSVFRALSPR